MKMVSMIEMANSSEIFDVKFGGELSVKADGDGFSTFENDDEINYYQTKEQADKAVLESIVDDHLIIKGYGIHSGRKFWQLPKNLQQKIRFAAINA